MVPYSTLLDESFIYLIIHILGNIVVVRILFDGFLLLFVLCFVVFYIDMIYMVF